MGFDSKIPWCHHTFNYWIGCDEVGPECAHCYAREMAKFRGWAEWGKGKPRHLTAETNRQKPYFWNRKAEILGTRYRVFSASLSDWLDEEVPFAWRSGLLRTVAETPNLDWLLLTKRLETLLKGPAHIIPENAWLGASIGARRSKFRLEQFPDIAFNGIRFLSLEPLLEDLGELDLTCIHWVIVGGESGPKARCMELAWARKIQAQCREQDVPFFFKQTGRVLAKELGLRNKKGEDLSEIPPDLQVRQFPKKSVYGDLLASP